MSQMLCTAVNSSLGNPEQVKQETRSAIDSLEKQLDSDDSITTEFATYHSDYMPQADASIFGSEKEFLRECVEQLWNEDSVCDGDSWVVVDGAWHHGYGRGGITCHPDSDNDITIVAARAFYAPGFPFTPEPVETFQNLAIHETLHNFDVRHKHGSYRSEENLFDVTPIATCYSYNSSNQVDTRFAGTGEQPSEFCDGVSNRQNGDWCDSCKHPCRWCDDVTSCAKQRVEEYSPL